MMGPSDGPAGDPAEYRGGSSVIPTLIEKSLIELQPAGIRKKKISRLEFGGVGRKRLETEYFQVKVGSIRSTYLSSSELLIVASFGSYDRLTYL